jgi:predicted phosphohydrolase
MVAWLPWVIGGAAIAADQIMEAKPLNQGEDRELDRRRKEALVKNAVDNSNRILKMLNLKPPVQKKKRGGKVAKVMKEHKRGTLRSGSGKKVKNRKQAVAIALNSKRTKK